MQFGNQNKRLDRKRCHMSTTGAPRTPRDKPHKSHHHPKGKGRGRGEASLL